MRISLPAAALLASFTLAVSHVRAEMAIGGFAPAINFFEPDAQGIATPSSQVAGDVTMLVEPAFGVYEPNEQVIYVSDFRGQALRVYLAFARGNVAPLRVLNPPVMAQTRASAPVFAHDEIGIIISNCCIATWPLHAYGDAVPRVRMIGWGGGSGSQTDLNNPLSLRYLPDTDEYVVSEYDRIVFHARTDGYDDPPTRRITGAEVANTISLAHDPATHRLYLLQQAQWDGTSPTVHGRIAVFDDSVSGDALPLYTIEGASTGLDLPPGDYFTGIGHDPYLHRLMAASSGNSADSTRNRVAVFHDDAIGDATLAHEVEGGGISTGSPGTPFAVPTDAIFVNGFDE
ncbi:MAG: hypothetical protein ABIR62_14280 [Dokdonella sp.]|uniref:hypothetical protein n=1 Tax=Dokdonella sp. TaxID=2291710 RepID=UPI0032649E9D